MANNLDLDIFSTEPTAPAKAGYKHKDGEVVAYGNISLPSGDGSSKIEAIRLRLGRKDHKQIVEAYQAAAKSGDPITAKAKLDAHIGSLISFDFQLANQEKRELDLGLSLVPDEG